MAASTRLGREAVRVPDRCRALNLSKGALICELVRDEDAVSPLFLAGGSWLDGRSTDTKGVRGADQLLLGHRHCVAVRVRVPDQGVRRVRLALSGQALNAQNLFGSALAGIGARPPGRRADAEALGGADDVEIGFDIVHGRLLIPLRLGAAGRRPPRRFGQAASRSWTLSAPLASRSNSVAIRSTV